MTPMADEYRMQIRLRAMMACPHIKPGLVRRPCRECELAAAIAEEREACAKLCQDTDDPDHWGAYFAAAIRARS